MGVRLKLFLKWGGLLIFLVSVVTVLSTLILTLILGNSNQAQLASILIASVFGIIFMYKFSYAATMEYLKGGANRWQKGIGFSIGSGVMLFSVLAGGLIDYIVTRQVHLSVGVSIVIGMLAGSRAEKKFLSQNPSIAGSKSVSYRGTYLVMTLAAVITLVALLVAGFIIYNGSAKK